jgi:hypothetical protein
MFAQIPETAQIPEIQARRARWSIVIAWLLMIASLLYSGYRTGAARFQP